VNFGSRTFRLFAPALLLAVFAVLASRVQAQAMYTATQQETLSVWAGATGTDVNLPYGNSGSAVPVATCTNCPALSPFYGGGNVGISVGVNLRVWQYHGFLPSVEVRGTFPIYKGTIAAEENAMVGIKIERPLGRYHPYGEFFFGRSEINYQGSGYISLNGLELYQQTISNVLAPGLGVDIDLTHHFAAKLDGQLWHQTVPITTSGKLNSYAVAVGAIYRFDFNHPFFAPRKARPASNSVNKAPGNSLPASTSP
jgi:hypothetical protein